MRQGKGTEKGKNNKMHLMFITFYKRLVLYSSVSKLSSSCEISGENAIFKVFLLGIWQRQHMLDQGKLCVDLGFINLSIAIQNFENALELLVCAIVYNCG